MMVKEDKGLNSEFMLLNMVGQKGMSMYFKVSWQSTDGNGEL